MDTRQHIQAFAYLLQQKGYHESFVLSGPPTAVEQTGMLVPLLEEHCFKCRQAGRPIAPFLLQTYAAYVNAWQFIGCEFSVAYSALQGFRITEVSISHNAAPKAKCLPIRDHHQVPNRSTVLGMFGKPRRWEQLMHARKARRRGL